MSERDLELPNLMPLVRKWAWLVVLGAVIALGAGYAVTKRTAPVYESSSQIFVNTASSASLSSLDISTGSAVMLASAVADMINSHRLADEVVQSLHVGLSADQLLDEMRASAANDTPIVTIDVRDGNPRLAARIANVAASTIIALYQTDQSSRYAGLKTALQRQINDANNQLSSATKRLAATETATPANPALVASLTSEIGSLQTGLSGLNSQLNTILLSQAQSDTAITVIDLAQVPSAAVSPSMPKNLLLALVFSLIATGAIVTAAEYLDDSIRTPEWIEKHLELPVLTVVGKFNIKKYTTLVADRPWDTNAEAFKTLRTNIQFMNVDQPPRTILICSGGPGEGKSTIAMNLAATVAQAGKRVILVDCDLRRPTVHKYLGLDPRPGLTEYLSDPAIGLQVARDSSIPNFFVVTSGSIPPNPSELLGSLRMGEFLLFLKEHADLVILDSSPVLAVTDPSVLAPHVDGILFVVDEEKSKMRATLRALQRFEMVGGNVLGVVFNKFNARSGNYGYYSSDYYRSDQSDTNNRSRDGKRNGRRERSERTGAAAESVDPGSPAGSSPGRNR